MITADARRRRLHGQLHWLLPAELTQASHEAPRRRTVRDWLVDLALFAFAISTGLLVWGQFDYDLVPQWMVTIDPWVGAASCLALWWRRRFPIALTVALVPAFIVSGTAFGAVLVALLTVAVHRHWAAATAASAGFAAMSAAWVLMEPTPDVTRATELSWVLFPYVVLLGWGMAVRARRQLVVSLRHEAERERREHQQRLSVARAAERQSIAREMHDTLAHRLSLLSVHAGALAYRNQRASGGTGPPLETGEVAEAVQVIRDSAQHALDELGQVLNVLRDVDSPESGIESAPRLSDLPRLAEDARRAGQVVDLTVDGDPQHLDRLSPRLQRTVYRTVQEGVTNARKHAPGAKVTVHVEAEPDVQVTVSVVNRLAVDADSGIVGFGLGLTGLSERVEVDGGELNRQTVAGKFHLRARLPWQT